MRNAALLALPFVFGCAGQPKPTTAEPQQVFVPAATASAASSPSSEAQAPERATIPERDWTNRPPATAEEKAMAERSFQAGRAHALKNEWPEACAAFRESMDYDPAMGTLLNLANCTEKLGNHEETCRLFRLARDYPSANDARRQFAARRVIDLGC